MTEPISNQNQATDMYYPSPDIVAAANVQEYEALYQRSLALNRTCP